MPFDELRDLERLWLLAIAHTDLKQAFEAAQLFLLQDLSEAAYECIQDALIVRYCRCFKICNLPNGRARTRLPDRFANVDGIDPALHAAICGNRDQIVAHSDMSVKDVILKKNSEGGEFMSLTSGMRFDREQVAVIRRLIVGVLQNIQTEGVPLAQRLLASHAIGASVELRALLVEEMG